MFFLISWESIEDLINQENTPSKFTIVTFIMLIILKMTQDCNLKLRVKMLEIFM